MGHLHGLVTTRNKQPLGKASKICIFLQLPISLEKFLRYSLSSSWDQWYLTRKDGIESSQNILDFFGLTRWGNKAEHYNMRITCRNKSQICKHRKLSWTILALGIQSLVCLPPTQTNLARLLWKAKNRAKFRVTPIFYNLVHPLEVIDVSTFANYNPKFAQKELCFDKALIFHHLFRISKK